MKEKIGRSKERIRKRKKLQNSRPDPMTVVYR